MDSLQSGARLWRAEATDLKIEATHGERFTAREQARAHVAAPSRRLSKPLTSESAEQTLSVVLQATWAISAHPLASAIASLNGLS